MAEAIVVTSRVLTPEEAEARERRMAALIAEVELELIEKGEGGTNEQFATDI